MLDVTLVLLATSLAQIDHSRSLYLSLSLSHTNNGLIHTLVGGSQYSTLFPLIISHSLCFHSFYSLTTNLQQFLHIICLFQIDVNIFHSVLFICYCCFSHHFCFHFVSKKQLFLTVNYYRKKNSVSIFPFFMFTFSHYSLIFRFVLFQYSLLF